MNRTIKRALVYALAALSPLLRTALCSAQEGSLDPTFGIGGTRIVNVSVLGTADVFSRLILRPGGKMLMGGNCYYVDPVTTSIDITPCLTQLLADGTYDGNFGPGGVGYLEFDHLAGWPTDAAVNDMIVLRDGRIALLGYFANPGVDSPPFVAVLLADGSALDSTVADTGYFTYHFNATTTTGNSLVQQPDGKILVAGTTIGVNGNPDFVVGRLLADLSGFDTSFGSGGSQTVAFDLGGPSGENGDVCTAVRLQSDGKIVLVGYSVTTPAGQSVSGMEISVARLNADGTRDTTFGSSGDGRVHYSAGNNAEAFALDARIDASDRIVVGGAVEASASSTSSQWLIDRLSRDGGRDAAFNQGNPQIFPQLLGTGGQAERLALTNDGIFAIGTTPRGLAVTTNYFAVARLKADGLLDARFGNGGLQYGGFRGNDVSTLNPDIAVGNGGVMVAATQEQNNGTGGGNYKFAIGRLQYDQVFSDGFE